MTASYDPEDIKNAIDKRDFQSAEKMLSAVNAEPKIQSMKTVYYVFIAYAVLNFFLSLNVYTWGLSLYAVLFVYLLKKNISRVDELFEFILSFGIWIPLSYILTAGLIFICGISTQALPLAITARILCSSIIFIGVLIWSSYRIGHLIQGQADKTLLQQIQKMPEANTFQWIQQYGFITTLALIKPALYLDWLRKKLNMNNNAFWKAKTGLIVGCIFSLVPLFPIIFIFLK